MKIQPNKRIILIRITSCKNYKFYGEHLNIISKNGYVWLLKSGRKIPDKSIIVKMNACDVLILKEPKNIGGKYYLAHFSEFRQGLPDDDMIFPHYYNSICTESDMNPLNGTWFKIDELEELPCSSINSLYLCSNHRKVVDVISQTRTSVMYVYSK